MAPPTCDTETNSIASFTKAIVNDELDQHGTNTQTGSHNGNMDGWSGKGKIESIETLQ
jgi:hypothetical protein